MKHGSESLFDLTVQDRTKHTVRAHDDHRNAAAEICFHFSCVRFSGRRRAGVTAAGSTSDSAIGTWSFQSDQESSVLLFKIVLNKNWRKLAKYAPKQSRH